MVPHETRAACRDTLTGCDLASICANLGLPGSGPRLFHFSPLSTLSANRAGTRRCAPRRDQEQPSGWNGLRLAEVRRSPPLPPHGYTFQPDFHRDFFPAFNQTTPKLKLPRLWGRLCYPHQPGLASGWLGHFIHTRSRSSARRRLCTTNQAIKQSQPPPRQQFASTSRMPSSCNRLAELIPTQPCRLGESRIVLWDFTSLFFFPFARICNDG